MRHLFTPFNFGDLTLPHRVAIAPHLDEMLPYIRAGYRRTLMVISNASCTTNCLAPLVLTSLEYNRL
jgi:hypothetical protein